jgi:hypothetical protein
MVADEQNLFPDEISFSFVLSVDCGVVDFLKRYTGIVLMNSQDEGEGPISLFKCNLRSSLGKKTCLAQLVDLFKSRADNKM